VDPGTPPAKVGPRTRSIIVYGARCGQARTFVDQIVHLSASCKPERMRFSQPPPSTWCRLGNSLRPTRCRRHPR